MATKVRAHQVLSSDGIKTLGKRLEEMSYIKPPVSAKTDLPASAESGERRYVPSEKAEYIFDAITGAWEVFGGSGSGSTAELNQVTKLGVTASSTSPKVVDIPISSTTSFKRMPAEVLKFTAGTTDVLTTEIGFSNAESTDFETNSNIVFDGKMKMKTSYSSAVTSSALGSGQVFSASFDKSQFKSITKIEVI